MKLSPNYSLLAFMVLLYCSLLNAQTVPAESQEVQDAIKKFNESKEEIQNAFVNKSTFSFDEVKKLYLQVSRLATEPNELTVIANSNHELSRSMKSTIQYYKEYKKDMEEKITKSGYHVEDLLQDTKHTEVKDQPTIEPQKPKKEDTKFANCDDELRKKLNELISDDKEGILKKQFELTTLKLAQKVQNNNQTTLEDYVRSKSKEIKEKDTTGKIEDLKKLYANEGKAKSLLKVYEHMDSLKESADKASYWNKNLRFYNEDASSFLLFDKMMDKESSFNETDVAITWYMQKLTKENRGSAETNQNNLSYNLTKLLGGMSAFKAKSQDELKEKTEKLSKDIDLLMASTIDSLKENLAMCFQDGLWKGGCEFTANHLNNEINLLLMTANEASSEVLEQSPISTPINFLAGKSFTSDYFKIPPLSLTLNTSIMNYNKTSDLFSYGKKPFELGLDKLKPIQRDWSKKFYFNQTN